MKTPRASSEAARARMLSQRRRDTLAEMTLRRALFARGFRYRVDLRIAPLRRRGDIVFTRWKVVVFVDGCFWHSCPTHGTVPRSNREWWVAKLRANVERDRETDHLMRETGWQVLRAWEHEPCSEALPRILDALGAAGANPRNPTSEATVRATGREAVRLPPRTAARVNRLRPSGRDAP